jgi:hypothetical protein
MQVTAERRNVARLSGSGTYVRLIHWGLLAVLVVAVGCGYSGPRYVPVSGTVLLGGAPVAQGTVQFFPAGGGRPSSGQLGSDGRYELTTITPGDGALPGHYVVTVMAMQSSDPRDQFRSIEDERAYYSQAGGAHRTQAGGVTWIVPERYSQRGKSPLTAEVASDGGEIDFTIPSEAQQGAQREDRR